MWLFLLPCLNGCRFLPSLLWYSRKSVFTLWWWGWIFADEDGFLLKQKSEGGKKEIVERKEKKEEISEAKNKHKLVPPLCEENLSQFVSSFRRSKKVIFRCLFRCLFRCPIVEFDGSSLGEFWTKYQNFFVMFRFKFDHKLTWSRSKCSKVSIPSAASNCSSIFCTGVSWMEEMKERKIMSEEEREERKIKRERMEVFAAILRSFVTWHTLTF